MIVRGADGSIVQGEAAAKAVQGSPILSAVMARAGLDPAIQLGERKAANKIEIEWWPVVARWPKRAQVLRDAGCGDDPGSFQP